MAGKTEQARPTVAAFVKAAVAKGGKSRRELAASLGYKDQNIVALFEEGLTRVPLHKVPALADALGVSRADLMKRVLGEYAPHLVAVFEDCSEHAATDNELEILQFIRRVSEGCDPPLASGRQRELLTEAFAASESRHCGSASERR